MANDTIQKRYFYKVYNTNLKYLTTWVDDVISDPTFRTVIDGGAGQLMVTLARPYDNFGENNDVALNNRVELWMASANNTANNASSSTVWDTAQWDVDLWDGKQLSFRKLYTGYISAYAPVLDNKDQYVDVTLLGFVTETSYRLLVDASNNTSITYTSKDPTAILQDAIDKYRADGGVNLNYTTGTTQLTGTTVNYAFKNNTIKEVLDKVVALAPDGWFWFVDTNGNVNFKTVSLTADHTLTIGIEIMYLQTTKRTEHIVNDVFLMGGGNPNLYNRYTRGSSVTSYGKHTRKEQDQYVTDNATADIIAKRILNLNQNPEVRTILKLFDNNGENTLQGTNIENFNIGDTIQIKNIKFGAKSVSLWDQTVWDTDVWDKTIQFLTADILTIVSITYNPDYIEIEAASRLPEITKRIEDLNTKLNTAIQTNLPTAATVRSV